MQLDPTDATGRDDHETLRRLLLTYQQRAADAAHIAGQLRALLLQGDEADRALARGRLGRPVLAGLSVRSGPHETADEQGGRDPEIRRLAVLVSEHLDEATICREGLRRLVDRLAPELTGRHRIGPIRAAEVILSTDSHQ
jgi:hypothetical protein